MKREEQEKEAHFEVMARLVPRVIGENDLEESTELLFMEEG